MSWLGRGAFLLGSAGLLLAVSTDALAVLGRHLGIPLIGAIEIVQASIVCIASAALITATLEDVHARVRAIIDRVAPVRSRQFLRLASAAGALVFLAIAIGEVWIARDLWYGHEVSEVLGLPIRALRFIWTASTLLLAAIFAVQAVRQPLSLR